MAETPYRLRPRPIERTKSKLPERGNPPALIQRSLNELDDRVGIAKFTKSFFDKIFPDHWSFFLGEIALYSFVVLVATGVFLTLYFVPSLDKVVYHGPYRPLDGTKVSEAFQSTMDISFNVRAGLLVRQIHHWSADVFIGAIAIHMCRIFFTSAYRKPRDVNWVVGVTLLGLSIFNGYFGYSLPDDLMSGTGVRIGYGILESIPFVGSYISVWFFGGQWGPGQAYEYRFFIFHVLIVPLALIGLLGLHLALIYRQEHTQFPGKHKKEGNVVGLPMLPTFAAKTTGLFVMIAGGLVLLGALAQIDPIWQLGPYEASHQSMASQPDWYLGWLEGALRLMPSWEWSAWGHTVPWNVFIPGVALPLSLFGLFYSWPFLERRITGDERLHQLVEAPRNRPLHTAIGAGVFAFCFMLTFAGGDDVIANFFGLPLNETVWALRVAQFAVPTVVMVLTYRICSGLRAVPSRRVRDPRAVVELVNGHYAVRMEVSADGEEPEPHEVPDAIIGGPVPRSPISAATGESD